MYYVIKNLFYKMNFCGSLELYLSMLIMAQECQICRKID